MDILGVGGWELVAILLIMLIVAGPKRMIQWSYTLGTYVSRLRKMWAEAAVLIQKEFDEAGVDVKVPKDIPTRADLNRELGRALSPVTKPFQETMDATRKEIDSTKQAISLKAPPVLPVVKPPPPANPAAETPAAPTPESPTPSAPPVPPEPTEENPAPGSNGHQEFGTWSQKT